MVRQCPRLMTEDWAAIVWGAAPDEPATVLGSAAAESAIPAGVRRRMSPFERALARCVLGLCRDDEAIEVTLGSRFGNLATATAMLTDIARGDMVSPMAFSVSVHNAVCGVLNQVRKDRTPHTAVAAGHSTVDAALTELYLRSGGDVREAAQVVVIGDAPLPPPLDRLENGTGGGAFVATRLRRADGGTAGPRERPGALQATDMVAGLQAGASCFEMRGGGWHQCAP